MIRRISDDEPQLDFKWYADVRVSRGHDKYITFYMFDPVDWEGYYCYYGADEILSFEQNVIDERKNKIDVIRRMIAFIDSREYADVKFIDDDEYHEYKFEI